MISLLQLINKWPKIEDNKVRQRFAEFNGLQVRAMKLLIIDDEPRICDSLKETLPLSELGIADVLTANSGEGGLAAFAECSPDIVITDIMMSGMNGLELIRSIRKSNSDVPILILSAYELFSYAKEAVDLGVTRYILKPIDGQEMYDAVKEAVEGLNMRRKLLEFNDTIQRQMRQHKAMLKEKFLYDALTMPIRFDDDFMRQLHDYDIAPAYLNGGLVVGLQVFRPNNGKAGTEKHWQMFRFAVQNIVQEVLAGWKPSYCLMFYNDIMSILFIGSDREKLERSAREATLEIIQHIYAYLEIEANAAIGRWYPHPSEYVRSYRESIEVLKFSEFEGYKRIDHIDEVCEISPGEHSLLMKQFQLIAEAVHRNDWQEAVNLWTSIEQSLAAREDRHPADSVKMLFVSLLGAVLVSDQAAADLSEWTKLSQAKTKSKSEWLTHVRAFLESGLASKLSKKNAVSPYTEYVVKYVGEHYDEDISFSFLAKELHLSRPYLSYVFRRDTGETFANYLMRYRVDVAKKIMKSSDHFMVREVASMVGYADPYYFSRMFKNMTGMSPSEFQMRC